MLTMLTFIISDMNKSDEEPQDNMDQERDKSSDNEKDDSNVKALTRGACVITKKWNGVRLVVEFGRNWTIDNRFIQNKINN